MPIFGTLDVEARGRNAPLVEHPALDSWETDTCEVLTVTYEIDDAQRLDLLPPALHPAIPLYAHIMLRKHGSSPVGAFNLGEIRIMSRAGSHYGGFCTGGFASTPEAVDFLRDNYGWPVQLGDVQLHRRYYGSVGSVSVEGRTVLDIAIKSPDPITPGDMLITASFHLCRTSSGLRLLQAEPHYEIEEVQRGTPTIKVIDTEAFGDARVKPTTPIVSTALRGSFQLGPVRYLIDPNIPATEGTERL